MRKEPEGDPVKEIGEFWNRQEEQVYDFDFARYNSGPWFAVKTGLSICMISLVYLIYGLHELPWSLYGSATGIIILVMTPFFAGMILGYTFENPKLALAYSLVIGFISIGISFFLMLLPNMLELAEYGPGFMKNVWFYGFFLPFLVTMSFVSAGTMLSASTNVYS